MLGFYIRKPNLYKNENQKRLFFLYFIELIGFSLVFTKQHFIFDKMVMNLHSLTNVFYEIIVLWKEKTNTLKIKTNRLNKVQLTYSHFHDLNWFVLQWDFDIVLIEIY